MVPMRYKAGNPTAFGATSTIPVTDGTRLRMWKWRSFRARLPNYALDQEDLGRIDYQMNPKDRFYLRYLYQQNPTVPAGGNFAGGGFYNVRAATHSVGGDWSRTFTTSLVNQVRYSFQQSTLAFDGGGVPNCTITNFNACPSTVALGAGLASFGYPESVPPGGWSR